MRQALWITYGTTGQYNQVPISYYLQRSMSSFAAHNPNVNLKHVHLDNASSTLCKAQMYALADPKADSVLFLDADTVTFGPMNYVFEMAERFGLACPICACPWQQRYQGQPHGVEYCTSSLCWKPKNRKIKQVFKLWEKNVQQMDTRIIWQQNGETKITAPQDQAGFGAAVHSLQVSPFVLPVNYNWSPEYYQSWFGKLYVWHSYKEPPKGINLREEPMDFNLVIKE